MRQIDNFNKITLKENNINAKNKKNDNGKNNKNSARNDARNSNNMVKMTLRMIVALLMSNAKIML